MNIMRNKQITKDLLIEKLYGVVEDYDMGDDKVRPMDLISAIKQISAMKGFNEPEKTEVITKTIKLEF